MCNSCSHGSFWPFKDINTMFHSISLLSLSVLTIFQNLDKQMYIHTRVYKSLLTYAYIYNRACKYVCKYVRCMCTYMYVDKCVWTYVSAHNAHNTYKCMYMYMYMDMDMHMHMHMYMYICIYIEGMGVSGLGFIFVAQLNYIYI